MMTPLRLRRTLAVALLVLHAVLLLASSRRNFVTIDETGYVPAGLSHWRTGTFALYRVNPPLPRMLATLPLLLLGVQVDLDAREEVPGERREWVIGPAFAAANAGRYFDLVCVARWAGVAWSLLGGWLIYRWAGELYGGWAGCLGLALWCFGPNVLAHAQLVTPDIPATVVGFAATYFFWHYLRRPSWPRAWFAGLLLGVAQLTKCTLLVLYGVWPLLAVAYWWRGEAAGPRDNCRSRLAQGAAIVALSLLVLNLGYGFAGSGRPLGDFHFVSSLFAGTPSRESMGAQRERGGNRFAGGWLGRLPVPLPADYLMGVDLQRRDFESGWPCYLAGEWRPQGCWYFYLYALAVKTPLGTLALALAGLALLLLRHPSRTNWRDELAVYLPAAILLLFVSSQTGLNYLRYVLPMAPFVFVGTARLAYFWRPGEWKIGAGVVGLLAWTVLSSLSVYPHSLAYFNTAAGGPERGYAHLIDSNLDWGQDLLRLKAWLDDHPEARPLYTACFTHVDPGLVGIDSSPPPFGPVSGAEGREEEGTILKPGYYAVSINYVQGMPFPAPDGHGRFHRTPPDAYGHFRGLCPYARIGYTLLIYRVGVDAASDGPTR